MPRSRTTTTTSIESGSLPIQEFIRRQRLRSDLITCRSSSSHRRRAFSPAPPPSVIYIPPPPPAPWTTSSHLAPFLLTLLLLSSAFHHLLGPTLQPLRYRTYTRINNNNTTSNPTPITRLRFLTTILPSAILFQTHNAPAAYPPKPICPPPPPPVPAPFATIHPTHPYAAAARASLDHLLALHLPIAADHAPVLASVRHATYPADRALVALGAVLEAGSNGGRRRGGMTVAARVADVRDAVRALRRASERWAAVGAGLLSVGSEPDGEGGGGVEAALSAGLRGVGLGEEEGSAPHDDVTASKWRFLWSRRGGAKWSEGTDKKEEVKKADVDWRLRTACRAAAFRRALDEIEGRWGPALLGLAEEVRRSVEMVDRAVLGACRDVGEMLERADLVCADALAVLWREIEPPGSASVGDIEGIWKAKVEAAVAAEALIKDLETLMDEVRIQRDGVDVWMMVLE